MRHSRRSAYEVMKLEFQNRWLRLLIEFLPAFPEIRRYRVVPVPFDRPTARVLRHQIAGQLRHPSSSSGGTSSASP